MIDEMCYAELTKFSEMTLDGRMFYFTRAATIIQLFEVLLKDMTVLMG
jgi:hypothetical protein